MRLRTLGARMALWIALTTGVSFAAFAVAAWFVFQTEERDELVTGAPQDPDADALNTVVVAVAVAAPIGLCLAMIGAIVLSRRALRPVDDLIRDAGRMSSPVRRLTVPVRQDELHRLVVALNGLFDRLETEWNAMAHFSAQASHELRTPLAVLATELEVGLLRPRTAAEWEVTATKALEEVRRLSRLADALLRIAKAGSAPIDAATDIDLRAVVGDVTQMYSEQAAHAGIALALDIEDAATSAVIEHADAAALESALGSIVSNALRYTPRGGSVAVRLKRCGDGRAAVHVDDTGPGLAPGDTPFVPFSRGAAAQGADARHGDTGFGLGLALSKRIVERHGGLISAGKAPSGGARFTMELGVRRQP